MSFLYHFRVRIWLTNPDGLKWGAKALPKNTKNL